MIEPSSSAWQLQQRLHTGERIPVWRSISELIAVLFGLVFTTLFFIGGVKSIGSMAIVVIAILPILIYVFLRFFFPGVAITPTEFHTWDTVGRKAVVPIAGITAMMLEYGSCNTWGLYKSWQISVSFSDTTHKDGYRWVHLWEGRKDLADAICSEIIEQNLFVKLDNWARESNYPASWGVWGKTSSTLIIGLIDNYPLTSFSFRDKACFKVSKFNT